jgi:hypothetical protein
MSAMKQRQHAIHHRGVAISPPGPDDEGIPATICCARRDRRYACAGNQSLWAAALPIHRTGQDPPATHDNGGRRQLGQDCRLVRRDSLGSDAMLTLCCSTEGRLIPAPNSPPVSMLGGGHQSGEFATIRIDHSGGKALRRWAANKANFLSKGPELTPHDAPRQGRCAHAAAISLESRTIVRRDSNDIASA